jgi:hypothetical protein
VLENPLLKVASVDQINYCNAVAFFLLLNWLYNIELKYGHNNELKQEVLGRTDRLHSLDTTRTAKKTTPPTILHCRWNVFIELLPSNDKGIHRPTDTRPAILLLLLVFFAVGTCLLGRCLATIGGIHAD